MRPDPQNATASQYVVRLTCNDNSHWSGERDFILSAAGGDAMYATVLTALSLGKSVTVTLADAAMFSLVERLYLNPT